MGRAGVRLHEHRDLRVPLADDIGSDPGASAGLRETVLPTLRAGLLLQSHDERFDTNIG